MKRLAASVVVVFTLLLGYPPQPYGAALTVNGDAEFAATMQRSVEHLSTDPTLAYWVLWAARNGVIIHQSPTPALFYPDAVMTAIGRANTIVVHPWHVHFDTTTLAVMLVHEIRHLMNYPDINECEPYTDMYLAAYILKPAMLSAINTALDDCPPYWSD